MMASELRPWRKWRSGAGRSGSGSHTTKKGMGLAEDVYQVERAPADSTSGAIYMYVKNNDIKTGHGCPDAGRFRPRVSQFRKGIVKREWLWTLVAAACLAGAEVASAEEAVPVAFSDSTDLTLEQLVNIQVTSVSKKEQNLNDAAAAISVVTGEDVRKFGITTIPEALRLVPGMDVAQINSHEWAVSARGFNGQFANKLLVMVDGRSVYGTGFGGVVWGVQDIVMEDLDRIEVIRGPGATLWGANAVNGVINIITKSAKDTQGTLITAAGGTIDRPVAAVRYGGRLQTNLFYRVYAKGFNRDGLVETGGPDAPDDAREIQGGMRVDWEPSEENRVTLQGDYYYDRFVENQDLPSLTPPYGANINEVNHDRGGNVLGRWTHELPGNSTLALQAYYDYAHNEQAGAVQTCDTIDFDGQHRFALGSRNDVVWGLGYRWSASKLRPSFFVAFNPAQKRDELFSWFVQDEITVLPDRVKVTIGSKFEHNDYTGFEFEPGARVLWTPTERQTVWAAVSRAVRTPSLSELYERVNLQVFPPVPPNPPTLVSAFGNPNLDSEELIAYELGFRIELTRQCALDVAGFYNDYDKIILPMPGTPGFEVNPPPPHGLVPTLNQNAGPAHTYGVEVSARYNVTDRWHLMAGYTWFNIDTSLNSPLLTASPEQQVQLRSTLNLPANLELNGAVYYVDRIQAPLGLGSTTLQDYVRLDLGLVWRPTPSWELGVWGQNLTDRRHAEFTSYKTSLMTEIPRSVVGRITWRF